MLTAGYLKSCLHHVVAVPGQEMVERYRFACLMRPEEEEYPRQYTEGGAGEL